VLPSTRRASVAGLLQGNCEQLPHSGLETGPSRIKQQLLTWLICVVSLHQKAIRPKSPSLGGFCAGRDKLVAGCSGGRFGTGRPSAGGQKRESGLLYSSGSDDKKETQIAGNKTPKLG